MIRLHHGDCLEVMDTLAEASIDAIVTDPPYGLGFMGKKWDDLPPGEDWARECLRVLKPGGHLLAFGGTRTWHRLAVAVEDAGFEIRDSIAWMYGSGFPKSLDVSKAIDKLDAADERRVRALMFTSWMRSTGIHSAQINDITGTNMGNHYLTDKEQPAVATADLFDKLRPHLPPVPDDIEELVRMRTVESQNFKARNVLRVETRTNEPSGIVNVGQGKRQIIERKITDAHTAEARKWQGWGTALKPAHEPIIVARRPFKGTVAENIRRCGVGALNVGASGSDGRWPANVVLDEDQAAVLDKQSGAGKFFYCAKAPKNERPVVNGVAHPTVKPLSLMRWLVRLVTPAGGTVLDPFAGSGTTVEAALLEGFSVIAIEREAEYLPLIGARIKRATP